jgi:hypothetical protein
MLKSVNVTTAMVEAALAVRRSQQIIWIKFFTTNRLF